MSYSVRNRSNWQNSNVCVESFRTVAIAYSHNGCESVENVPTRLIELGTQAWPNQSVPFKVYETHRMAEWQRLGELVQNGPVGRIGRYP